MTKQVANFRSVPLDKIRIDGETQARAGTREAVVKDYQADMEMGDSLPALVAFFDGSDYWLADGFHRFLAAQRLKWETMDCEVYKGSQHDAAVYALGANHGHGLQRSPEDKRKAVKIALSMPEFKGKSDRVVAEACKVSHTFVGDVIRTMESKPSPNGEPSGADSTSPKSKTGKDGRKVADKKPGKGKADKTPKGKKPKAGDTVYDWSGLWAAFKPLPAAIDAIDDAYDGSRGSEGWTACDAALCAFISAAEAWQKKLTGSKPRE